MVKKADEVLKDLVFIAIMIFLLSFAVRCFAQETFDEVTDNPKNPIVDTILGFDNMEIHLKHSEVRSYRIYRDADENEIRREAGPNFIYKNEDADDPETLYDENKDAHYFYAEIGLE